jgi:hypothetical protein
MRRTIVALVPIVGLIALAACSTDQGTSPRSIISQQALASGGPPAPSCSFNNMTKAARNYLSSTDPVLDAINLMQSAYNTNNGGAVAATPRGWDVLRLIAQERLTSHQGGSAAQGAILVGQVFLCMADLTTSPATIPMPVPPDFTTAGHDSLALSVGIFEVRAAGDDATGAGAALAIYKATPTSARSATPPGWGVEPNPTAAPPSWPTGPFLVYSYPTNLIGAFVSSATPIDFNYNAFEMGKIPASTPVSGLLVGVCYSSVTGTTVANRLTHSNSQIFTNVQPTFCPATVASLNSSSFFLSMVQRAARWLSPSLAYAQQDAFFIGGLPDGWSPFTAGALVGTSIQPSFNKQPANTVVGAADSVTVLVTVNSVPVPSVAIVLTIANNSGSPAGAIFVSAPIGTTGTFTSTTPGGTTDDKGLVKIYFSVGKAGGYTLTAAGNLDVVATSSATSKLFNVKNP